MNTQSNTNEKEDINANNFPMGSGNHVSNTENDSKSNSNDQPRNEEIKPKKAFNFIKKKKTPDGTQPTTSPMNSSSNDLTSVTEPNDQQKDQDSLSNSSNSLRKGEEIVNSKMNLSDNSSNAIKENTLNKPPEKKAAFNFIKKKTPSTSASLTSPKPNQEANQLNSLDLSLPTSTNQKSTKEISLILDSPYKDHKMETDKNNLIIHNQLKEFKQFLKQLTQIRNEIQIETDIKTQLEQSIVKLTDRQISFIEENNFEEAIKVEEEIKANTENIKHTANIIKLKSETHLHNIKTKITDVFKAKANQFSFFITNLSHIQTKSTEAIALLNETEKVSIEELSKTIDLQSKETDDLNLEYQESLHQIERTEGTYEKLFQEETKELTDTINDLNTQHDNLKAEIDELQRILREKEALLQSVNKQIDEHTNEKQAIKEKYITEESYIKFIKSKDMKKNVYNASFQKLSELKSKHSSLSNHYNSKLKEISDIIDTINNLKTNDLPKNNQINEVIETMKSINQNECDKRTQIHLNEKTIEDYLIKINENNEKIEVLDLQNKRISNDIVSLDTNIKNLDEVKKAHVAKKQFKDAQTVTLEIKRYNEKNKALDDLLNENNKEINSFKGENEIHINQVEALRKLIEQINDEINENTHKYTNHYLYILKETEQELMKIDDQDSALIRNEIDIIEKYISSSLKSNENPSKEKDNEIYHHEIDNNVNGEFNNKEKHEGNDNDNEKNEDNNNDDEPITEHTPETQTIENITSQDPELSNEELKIQIEELESKLAHSIEVEDFEEADNLNKKLEDLNRKMESN